MASGRSPSATSRQGEASTVRIARVCPSRASSSRISASKRCSRSCQPNRRGGSTAVTTISPSPRAVEGIPASHLGPPASGRPRRARAGPAGSSCTRATSRRGDAARTGAPTHHRGLRSAPFAPRSAPPVIVTVSAHAGHPRVRTSPLSSNRGGGHGNLPREGVSRGPRRARGGVSRAGRSARGGRARRAPRRRSRPGRLP